MLATDRPQAPAAIQIDLGAIFVSMELSKSTWLIKDLRTGDGRPLARHVGTIK